MESEINDLQLEASQLKKDKTVTESKLEEAL